MTGASVTDRFTMVSTPPKTQICLTQPKLGLVPVPVTKTVPAVPPEPMHCRFRAPNVKLAQVRAYRAHFPRLGSWPRIPRAERTAWVQQPHTSMLWHMHVSIGSNAVISNYIADPFLGRLQQQYHQCCSARVLSYQSQRF